MIGEVNGVVTFEDIRNNAEIRTYIEKGNENLGVLGFTKHSVGHATKVSDTAAKILEGLDYDARTVELARIAGYMHDIGNSINRHDHAHSGAILAYQILKDLGMPLQDIVTITGAIGHHDEATGTAVDVVSAAVILADKTDVRRSRVRNKDMATFDIHDRVNYSVERSEVLLDVPGRTVTLSLSINTQVCAVMDYFEIFLQRMLLCRRAAEALSLKFRLEINGQVLL